MRNVNFSFDKVSIILRTKAYISEYMNKEYQYERIMTKNLEFLQKNKLIEEDLKYSKLYHYHFQLLDGIDFQFMPKYQGKQEYKSKNELSGEETRLIVYFDRDNFFRFEFNPNNTDIKVISEFLKFIVREHGLRIQDVFISRLDMAIDYPVKLDLLTIEADKASCFGLLGKRSKGVQTNYQGSKSSDISFKIYDKKAELESRKLSCLYDEQTRIELTNSIGFRLDENEFQNYFERLCFSIYPIKTGDAFFNCILRLVSRDGIASVLGEFEKTSRAKYRKLIKEYESKLDFIHPSKVYDKYFSTTWEEFKKNLIDSMGFSRTGEV